MSRYKKGDKVRVRSDLEVSNVYGGQTFSGHMINLKGKIVTIRNVLEHHGYTLVEDSNNYFWTDEMLEPVEQDQPPSKRQLSKRIKELEHKYNRLNELFETFKDMQVEYDKATTLRLNGIEFKQMSDTEPVESEPLKWDYDKFIKGEFAVNCRTEVEAAAFCGYLAGKGLRWTCNGDSPIEYTCWDMNGADICYTYNYHDCEALEHSYMKFYESNNIPILAFSKDMF